MTVLIANSLDWLLTALAVGLVVSCLYLTWRDR